MNMRSFLHTFRLLKLTRAKETVIIVPRKLNIRTFETQDFLGKTFELPKYSSDHQLPRTREVREAMPQPRQILNQVPTDKVRGSTPLQPLAISHEEKKRRSTRNYLKECGCKSLARTTYFDVRVIVFRLCATCQLGKGQITAQVVPCFFP